MNKILLPALVFLALQVALQVSGKTAEESPQDWQKQSLKGITSIRYGTTCAQYKCADDVAKSLGEIKVKSKRIENLDKDSEPLTATEARVKVIAKDRENGQAWVGVCVEQRCQLERNPSINVVGETYKISRLCPRAKVKSTVKELCAEFVKDLSAQ